MKKADERLTFESSHGIIVCDGFGNIKTEESNLSDWLNNVKKIDVEELDNYYALNKIGTCEDGDVLDFGFWDNDGVYHAPEKDWRINTFHNQDFKDKEIKKVVSDSFSWIEKNR